MAKRELKATNEMLIKTATVPKAQENEFIKESKFMVKQIQQRFINQALKELNKGTIEKFEDKQIGNYAAIFMKLAEKVKQKLLNQFSNDRISKMIKSMSSKINGRNQKILYENLEKAIGINTKELIATEGLTYSINALDIENEQWFQRLRDQTIGDIIANSLRVMGEGGTLEDVIKEVKDVGNKKENNSAMLARTQINSFNNLLTKIRAQNLGAEEAIWVTSKDERVRKSHQARDGKRFKLSEGLYSSLDGLYLIPGNDYNCFEGSVKINNLSFCKKIYRRWYTGELTEIVFDDGTVLSATPNHPIMTDRGFVSINDINFGDNVVKIIDKGLNGFEFDAQNFIPTISEIFKSLNGAGARIEVFPPSRGNFHGDISNSEINIICPANILSNKLKSSIREKFSKLNLSESDKMIVLSLLTCQSHFYNGTSFYPVFSDRIMSLLDLVNSRFLRHLTPLELFCFTSGSWIDTIFNEPVSYNASTGIKHFRDFIFAYTAMVHGNNFIDWQLNSWKKLSNFRTFKPFLSNYLTQSSGVDINNSSNIFDHHTIRQEFKSVINKRVRNFSGHIYNLETFSGDYIADNTLVSNCRCSMYIVIPEE